MKINQNQMLAGVFCLVVVGAVGSKVGFKLTETWARNAAEEEHKALMEAAEKAKAELKLKTTHAAVLKAAEEYDAQRTGLGAYRRPGDGYKFTLEEKDSYGQSLLLLYSRGAVVDSFKVRSAGPDKTLYTEDDICEEKWSANGAGAVEGVKSSAGDLFQGAKDKIFGSKKP